MNHKFIESPSNQHSPTEDLEKLFHNRWDYSCTLCSRPFPSAQSLGGHLNAHRAAGEEENKLYAKDRISYRKRLFLQPTPYVCPSSVSVQPRAKRCRYGEGPSTKVNAGNELNLHGIQHNLKLLPIDLTLLPTPMEIDEATDMKAKSSGVHYTEEFVSNALKANASRKGNKNGNNIVKGEKLDLSLKL